MVWEEVVNIPPESYVRVSVPPELLFLGRGTGGLSLTALHSN